MDVCRVFRRACGCGKLWVKQLGSFDRKYLVNPRNLRINDRESSSFLLCGARSPMELEVILSSTWVSFVFVLEKL